MAIQTEWSQILASSAGEYCDLIDRLDQNDSDWLDNLSVLLPRIHAAISSVESGTIASHHDDPIVDLDKRFDLYSRLRKRLGDRDSYMLAFDKPDDLNGVSGSLADDFTDIYFELKKGLDLLRAEPDALSRAMGLWYGGYVVHWGQHLVDAERHLYDIHVHRQLSSNNILM